MGGVCVKCGQHLQPHLIPAPGSAGFQTLMVKKRALQCDWCGCAGPESRLPANTGLAIRPLVSQMASFAQQGAHFCAHPGTQSHGPVTLGRSALHLSAFDPEIDPPPPGGRAGLEKGAI